MNMPIMHTRFIRKEKETDWWEGTERQSERGFFLGGGEGGLRTIGIRLCTRETQEWYSIEENNHNVFLISSIHSKGMQIGHALNSTRVSVAPAEPIIIDNKILSRPFLPHFHLTGNASNALIFLLIFFFLLLLLLLLLLLQLPLLAVVVLLGKYNNGLFNWVNIYRALHFTTKK